MSEDIRRYLAELDQATLAGARRRRRILEEVEDHLAEAAERHQRTGLGWGEAQQQAINDFGEAPVVAQSFVQSRPVFDKLMRLSRHLAVVGAVLFAAAVTVFRIGDELVDGYVAALPGLLLLAALPGLHLRQASRAGLLGRVGFSLIVAAAALAGVMAAALGAFALAGTEAPYGLLGIGIIAAALLVTGLVVFAISALRARVFPRSAVALLLVASAALPVSFDQDWNAVASLVPAWFFAFAWILLGNSGPLLPAPTSPREANPSLAAG